jgi:PAS domain-containing protein
MALIAAHPPVPGAPPLAERGGLPSSPPFERAVLDALPLTVWTVDLEGRITSVNRSWGRFAEANGAPGLADEVQVQGTSIWDAVSDPASREQMERAHGAPARRSRAGRALGVSVQLARRGARIPDAAHPPAGVGRSCP